LKKQHESAYRQLEEDNENLEEDKENIKKTLTSEITMMDKEQKTYRDDKEGEEWNKIDEIKEKNKEELYVKTKFGLKSKAELTLTNTKFLESKRKREANERELDELTNQLDNEL
jgi:hypothetical protein